jgi:uncharacterized membrane protein (UPF0127 family)
MNHKQLLAKIEKAKAYEKVTYRQATFQDPDRNPIIEVTLERAVTLRQQYRGLMGRTHLEENHGMVFISDWEGFSSIWMKDTILCLDIIFLDRFGRIVTIHHSAEPMREDIHYYPSRPAKFTVELQGGFCKAHGIEEGYYLIPEKDERV